MRLLLESISGIGLLLKQILSNQKHISRRKLSKRNNQITMSQRKQNLLFQKAQHLKFIFLMLVNPILPSLSVMAIIC